MTAPSHPPLSPAAQAVLDAFRAVPDLRDCSSIAAALRAVADQVAPENYECFTGYVAWDQGSEARNDAIRESILAIATELEGSDDHP
jgi:hypothetical protein